ncbi:hypothetical protein BJ508DRAFT_306401 [Ascobolus immersus RN42]|uniref:Uncharacterized protein n=1 Tax=Ascobolus immersus RN42 TaxID=1160509 RepID=A0A3N4IBP0_ASCIM|nr:hypothetical protein BJ508DRAFT_306401 [Ascobolus immersus RN42]
MPRAKNSPVHKKSSGAAKRVNEGSATPTPKSRSRRNISPSPLPSRASASSRSSSKRNRDEIEQDDSALADAGNGRSHSRLSDTSRTPDRSKRTSVHGRTLSNGNLASGYSGEMEHSPTGTQRVAHGSLHPSPNSTCLANHQTPQRYATWETDDFFFPGSGQRRPLLQSTSPRCLHPNTPTHDHHRLYQQDNDADRVMVSPGIWTNRSRPSGPEFTCLTQAIDSVFDSDMDGIGIGATVADFAGDAFDVQDIVDALESEEQRLAREQQELSEVDDSDAEAEEVIRRATVLEEEEEREARRPKRGRQPAAEPLPEFVPQVYLKDPAGKQDSVREVNKSLMAIFVWVHDHNISLSAYNSLVQILLKDWFSATDIPLSYTTIKNLRVELPTLPIYAADIPVEEKKGDSSTKEVTTGYFHKLAELMESQIKNPQLFPHMHQGLGLEVDKSSEAYHGPIYKESIKAAIPDYPVRPKEKGLTDAMVYPGSCLMLGLSSGKMPVRVTGVFKNKRSEDIKLFPEYKDAVWASVNPIVIRKKDVTRFRLNPVPQNARSEEMPFEFLDGVNDDGDLEAGEHQDSEEEQVAPTEKAKKKRGRKPKVDPMKENTELAEKFDLESVKAGSIRGYIINQTYRIPVACLGKQAKVKIFRHKTVEDHQIESEQKDVHETPFHVRQMVTPEAGSTPDQLLLLEAWRQHQHDLATSHLRKRDSRLADDFGDKNTFTKPTNVNTTTTRRRRERAINKIRVERLVLTSHLRKTLAEDEIEKGEVDLDELYFDKPPKSSTSTETRPSDTSEATTSGDGDVTMNDAPGPNPDSEHAPEPPPPNRQKRRRKNWLEGFDMTLPDGEEVTVFVKLLSISADMMEANALASVKSPTCISPCRFCELPKLLFNANTIREKECVKIERLRQKWFFDEQMKATLTVKKQKGVKRTESIITRFGPAINPFVQISLDISHSEQKGIGELLLKYLADQFFSKEGAKEYTRVLRRFKFPPEVCRKANFAYHVKYLKMNEITTIIACLPFMLQRMRERKVPIFKQATITTMNADRDEANQLDASRLKQLLIVTFLAVAKANKLIFSREIDLCTDEKGEDGFVRMAKAVAEARIRIYEVLAPLEKVRKKNIEEFNLEVDEAYAADREAEAAMLRDLENDLGSETDSSVGSASYSTDTSTGGRRKRQIKKKRLPTSVSGLPNYHNACHMITNARNYGSGLNTSCSVGYESGEIVHRVWKNLVPHTNYVELDLVFCRYSNTMMAIRALLDDCYPKHKWKATLDTLRDELPTLCTGFFWGQQARVSEEDGVASNTSGPGAKLNIYHGEEDKAKKKKEVGAEVGAQTANSMGYPTNIAVLPDSDRHIQRIRASYKNYGFPRPEEITLNHSYKYGGCLQWWEWISLFDTLSEQKVTYRPGLTFTPAYAEIYGICTHRNIHTDKDYVFFNIRWLTELEEKDIKFGNLPKYKISRPPPEVAPAIDGVLENRIDDNNDDEELWFDYISLESLSPMKPPHFVKDIREKDVYFRNDYYFKSI